MLLLAVPVAADTPVTIAWKDSVVIEEVDLYEAGTILNMGRATWASIPATRIGDNYGGARDRTLYRINTFKDSTDLHSGLIIDSLVLALVVNSESTITGAETLTLEAGGIDTNRNWVEGNRNAGEGLNCEVTWDSTQQVGTGGSCASAQEWLGAGATGTTDTMGLTTGKPADNVVINAATSIGDIILLYVDTTVGNIWMATADANEGIIVRWTAETVGQGWVYFYSSEYNGAGRADSIPTFTLYGYIPGEAAAGQVIIIGQNDAETHYELPGQYKSESVFREGTR